MDRVTWSSVESNPAFTMSFDVARSRVRAEFDLPPELGQPSGILAAGREATPQTADPGSISIVFGDRLAPSLTVGMVSNPSTSVDLEQDVYNSITATKDRNPGLKVELVMLPSGRKVLLLDDDSRTSGELAIAGAATLAVSAPHSTSSRAFVLDTLAKIEATYRAAT